MKLRNPWVDPRVAEVRSNAAQAYLVEHGWEPLTGEQPNMSAFTRPKTTKNSPIVQVPLRENARDYTQRVIEFVTDLALAEGRHAVDVLNEILQVSPDTPAIAGNGPRSKSKVH
jgi:hypothetical protein